LISPPFFADGLTAIELEYYENFDDTLEKPLSVLVTDNHTGDPSTTAWIDVTPDGLNGSMTDAYVDVASDPFALTGNTLRWLSATSRPAPMTARPSVSVSTISALHLKVVTWKPTSRTPATAARSLS
jgi:hypothetical protein